MPNQRKRRRLNAKEEKNFLLRLKGI